MSRFALICSLVFGMSSATLISTADAQFAKAPPERIALVTNASPPADGDVPVSFAQLRIAPRRAVDRAAVRAALAKARATNLAAFHVYQQTGVFPSNTYKPGKLNVWLDADGHFCAAATIIKMSGQDALVTKVAEQNNFIRLADVKQGPLMDWILTSGLTQAEIAMIQEPFLPVDREPSLVGPVLVDAKLRKAENARLLAKYKRVEKQLAKSEKKSLDQAADRIMKTPELAWRLVDNA